MYSSFTSLNSLKKKPSGQNIFTHKHLTVERQNFQLQYVCLGSFCSVDFGCLLNCSFVYWVAFFYGVVCLFVYLAVLLVVFSCVLWHFFVSTNPWRLWKSQKARSWNHFWQWEFWQWLPQDHYFILLDKLRVNKQMSVPWKCEWNKSG